MLNSANILLYLFVLLAGIGSTVGVWLTGVPGIARRVIPFSGAILILVATFWVWPEVIVSYGWITGTLLILSGAGALWVIDRFVYPVCPSCSHDHGHDDCITRLHGFAMPLIAATLLHSLFDGWALAAAESSTEFGRSITFGLWLHKIPESLAFGVILKSALPSRNRALTWVLVIQLAVLLGAAIEKMAEPYVPPGGAAALLAIGGGTFLYLGYHAVEAEWRRYRV